MRIVASVFGALALVCVCLADLTQVNAQPRTRVVSSFSIVGEIVQRVGGDRIDHRVLVGANTDSHTYEPTPQDTAGLASAQLVVQIGLGFEPWLDRLYDASGARAPRLAAGDGLDALPMGEGEPATSGGHDHAHTHAHGEVDPHVWHDVGNMMRMVAVVRDSLTLVDPAGAAVYEANAASYLAELQELDAWVIAQVSAVPSHRRKLVTAHDTFGYFARRYGFEVVGTALGSATTDTADPSAGAVAELVSQIRAAGVPAIFAENVSNPRLMQQIASAAGVQVVTDLFTDALGDRGSPGATYDGLMRHNVGRIVGALSQ